MILGSLFQDGAVLQRDKYISVWGMCQAGVLVEAVFDGNISRTRSSSDGKFILYLPPHAAGGPFELSVTAAESGERVLIKDILVGEVWLASGQSNMEYKLNSDMRVNSYPGESIGRKQEKQFKEMIMDAGSFRIFTVDRCVSGAPESICGGQWQLMNEENCGDISAVAAWFGLGLQYQLDVPIGIIVSAVGGSIAEAWISREALCAMPETAEMAEMIQRSHLESSLWEKGGKNQASALEDMPGVSPDSGNEGFGLGYADNDFDDSSWQSMVVGGSWMQQNICGNGAVWIRKTVDLPESWANTPLLLSGGTVDKHDISYFNGIEIGRTGKDLETEYYNFQRQYPISPELVKSGKNTVAIRAFSFAFDGAVTGEWNLVNKCTGEKISLNGQWAAKAEYDRGNAAGNVPATGEFFGPGNHNTPCVLFEAMIRPLLPYAMRGVIWYQGESNAYEIKQARAYRDIMQGLIDDWRRCFRNPAMPFIMVQLAGFGGKEDYCSDSAWAELREAQRLIAQTDPDTFMASAIDIGDPEDVHPENKFDVGKRLAMCALHCVYGNEEIIPCGPELLKWSADGNKVKISFKYADGLKLKEKCSGFAIAGSDGKFYLAEKVEVSGDTVTVSSVMVSSPVAVRYAWSAYPVPSLFNAAGFPASSFQINLEK